MSREKADRQHRFKVYRLSATPQIEGNTDYAELASDIDHRVVAGLIISMNPGPVQRQVLRLGERSGLPVTLHGSREDSEGLPLVLGDARQWFHMALEHLGRRSRRRVALLCGELWYDRHGRHFEDAAAAAVLERRPIWLQHLNNAHHRSATHLVRLLMSLPADQRPDGLILDSQHLARTVHAALLDAGMQPGRDLDVVVHLNFPANEDHCPSFDFAWLGYDAAAFVDAFLDQLQVQTAAPATPRAATSANDRPAARRGGDQIRLIPPRFAGVDELGSDARSASTGAAGNDG